MNAFATGRDPEHSSITVTSGLLEKMNREELEGVLAHEMSHIKNYDIRFATLVAVMVGMIVIIADIFGVSYAVLSIGVITILSAAVIKFRMPGQT